MEYPYRMLLRMALKLLFPYSFFISGNRSLIISNPKSIIRFSFPLLSEPYLVLRLSFGPPIFGVYYHNALRPRHLIALTSFGLFDGHEHLEIQKVKEPIALKLPSLSLGLIEKIRAPSYRSLKFSMSSFFSVKFTFSK